MTQTHSSAAGGDSTVDKKRTNEASTESTNVGAGNSSNSISSISSGGNDIGSNISSSSNTSSSDGDSSDVIAGNIITTTINNKDSNNRSNLKQAKISDCDHVALDKNTESETNSVATAEATTTTTTLSKELNSYATVGMHENFQDILESDLSCAICQDIYINPLILNCSHSFCKFCVFRWLSKKTDCPQCRMTVQFQAENLALRNIINRMVLKASPQFQAHRTNSVNQRLKAEEAQEKDGTNRAALKNSSASGARHNRSHQNQERNERTERRRVNVNQSFILRVFPSTAPSAELEDHWSSDSESSVDESEFNLFMENYANGGDDADTTGNSNDEDNDVTFEMSSDDTSSSEDDEDDDDDEDADMETGESDESGDGWGEDMFAEVWEGMRLEREDDNDEIVSVDEDNVNVDDDETIDFLASSSSSSSDEDGDDDTDVVTSPEVSLINFSLPDTDSDPGTASDDSTEEYSSESYMSGRYSRESSIVFGTTDDDDDDENEEDDDDSY